MFYERTDRSRHGGVIFVLEIVEIESYQEDMGKLKEELRDMEGKVQLEKDKEKG